MVDGGGVVSPSNIVALSPVGKDGVPPPVWKDEVPSPTSARWGTRRNGGQSENITFRHPSDVGGNK